MRTRERHWPVAEIEAWRSACRIGAGTALLAAASGAWAGYVVTPLGDLYGSDNYALGINNVGQAVGYSFTAGYAAMHATWARHSSPGKNGPHES